LRCHILSAPSDDHEWLGAAFPFKLESVATQVSEGLARRDRIDSKLP
jgi:hypothetical protein